MKSPRYAILSVPNTQNRGARPPPETLPRAVRRVVLTQALLTLGVALGFGVSHDLAASQAALYGGTVAILVSAWQGWRMQRAAGLGAVYLSVMARYAMVVMLLVLGLKGFRLAPIPLVVAFAVTQFGYLVYIRRARGRA